MVVVGAKGASREASEERGTRAGVLMRILWAPMQHQNSLGGASDGRRARVPTVQSVQSVQSVQQMSSKSQPCRQAPGRGC